MKKLVSVVLVFILVCGFSFAEIDLSGMSFEELVELQKSVTMAIMESDGWQEVVVPQGTYTVGIDIPAGKWMLVYNGDFSAVSTDNPYSHVMLTNDENKAMIELFDGQNVEIEYSSVIFTPFTGNLGFK